MSSLPCCSLSVGILLSLCLVACSATHGRHLRRAKLNLTVGVQPPVVVMDPAMAAGMKVFFSIQRVGLQKDGMQPRSPLSRNHRHCLTAGPVDHLKGNALKLMRCSDADLTPPGEKVNRNLQDFQAFHFLNNGQIRNKITGLCVRRIMCGLTPVYDLGPCSEEASTTVWTVTKAVANQVGESQFLGYPLYATVKEMCNMCGPYQLLQKCKDAPLSSTSGCGEQGPPVGWTKLPASTEQADVKGEDAGGVVQDIVDVIDEREPMDGMAADVDPKGHCGTQMTDGLTEESWYYFLKIGK